MEKPAAAWPRCTESSSMRGLQAAWRTPVGQEVDTGKITV